jgi:signal transduction histidine kinase
MPGWSDRRLRWLSAVLCALTIAAAVGYLIAGRGLHDQPALRHPYRAEPGEVFGATLTALLGLVLSWHRPRSPIGWLIGAAGLLLASCDLGQTYGMRALALPAEHLPLGTLALSLSAPLWIGTVFIPVSLVLVRYPSGAVQGRWPRRFERAVLLGLLLVYLAYAFSSSSVTDEVRGHEPPLLLPEPVAAVLGIPGVVLLIAGTAAIVGDAVRRTVRADPRERPALLLLLTASVLAAVLIFFGPAELLGSIAFFGVLVAVGIGVLRYGALGIEVVVRRTLVYAILTGLVLAVFVGVVTLVDRVLPEGQVAQLVGAIAIAVGIGPARSGIQRAIDRLVYGERDDPFAALKRLGTPMGAGNEAGDLVPEVLGALVESLRVEGAALEGPGLSVSVGDVGTAPTTVALSFGGQDEGVLRVGSRAGQRRLASADVKLIEAIAPWIAAAVHAVRLADDLKVEQQRVIAATHSERSRLRQELHDGLGPSLTGIGLGLEATQRTGASEEMLARLREEVAASLEEVRRIIEDLQPSALDGGDLVEALRRRTEQVGLATGLDVRLEAPRRLEELSEGAASAAYRIVDEAMTNVVRHAGATRCTVQVSLDDCLHIEVRDNGAGPGEPRDGGVGLASMRDRAERLGGRFTMRATTPGTLVAVDLPSGPQR